MNASYFTDPLVLVIEALSSLYILAVLMRFLLQWCGADFYNPISQFLVRATQPPLRLMRRYIPPIGKIDTSSLILMLFLQMLANFLIGLLQGATLGIGALTLIAIMELINLLFNVFIFSIIARALLSWLNPGRFDAASSILYSLTEPVLNIFRRIIPDLGGIDLSPLAALLFLQVARMIILPPLSQLAALIAW
ncbi:YggT family protein [Methylomicrobium sp. RS1]|jgi:YggT family protein|uniref:YggT family protein n=1 Tax=Candidatus Methylomicrobium oryzae TaxID=2802053 RepID=UPI001922F0A2|nr:YggT family protein [Methylomicrobium sp. RS1]MBL1263614.1 YggT family protein [Methylomicrobium sp. RS1]